MQNATIFTEKTFLPQSQENDKSLNQNSMIPIKNSVIGMRAECLVVQGSPGQPEESPTRATSLSLGMEGKKDLQRGLNPLPACLWGCWRLRWPWELFPCCKKRAAPFTMKKLSLRLGRKNSRSQLKGQSSKMCTSGRGRAFLTERVGFCHSPLHSMTLGLFMDYSSVIFHHYFSTWPLQEIFAELSWAGNYFIT